MVRVLFVNRVLGMFRGGGETYTINLAKHLHKLGCEVKLITAKPYFGKVRYPIEEFHTEYVSTPYLRDLAQWLSSGVRHIKKIPFPSSHVFLEKCYHHLVWRFHNLDDETSQNNIFKYLDKRKKDYDIVQIFSHASLAGRIAEVHKMPVVLRFPGPPSITSKMKENILKCDAVVANGDAFLHIKNKITKNVINIPPGIDTKKFRPVNSNVREKHGISTDDKLVLFVGRFVPIKNLHFMIKGMSEVIKSDKKVKLIMVGIGPIYNQAIDLVSKLNIQRNVIFAGRVTHDILPEYYSAADIFLLTSDYDNFPNVVIEAMACGLPVVATKVGGLNQLVEDNITGFGIENNNINDLKEKVLGLLNNKELCKEISERNIEFVIDRYSWEKSARQFLKIYEDILKGSKC